MKFDGSSGKRPSVEARRYVYAVTAASLDTDLCDPEGWVLGGLVDEADIRRAKKATKLVIAELVRKGRGKT